MSTATKTEHNLSISADEIENYNASKLREFLRKQSHLDLSEKVFEILEKEEISGCAFLQTTREKFLKYKMPGGPASVLANFAKKCDEKIKSSPGESQKFVK